MYQQRYEEENSPQNQINTPNNPSNGWAALTVLGAGALVSVGAAILHKSYSNSLNETQKNILEQKEKEEVKKEIFDIIGVSAG